MAEAVPETPTIVQEDTTGPRLIRITNHGKMHTWVKFALESLEKQEDRPIVLHTLPAPPKLPTNPDPTNSAAPAPQHAPPALSNVTTMVPRLISVVEIIKREYIKILETKRSPRLLGLHQYNETGCLEDLGLTETPEALEGSNDVVSALSGKNHVQQKQTPYMKVTLSTIKLGDDYKNTTYQPPAIRKMSKSAKARAKKRERKANKPEPEGAMEEGSKEEREIGEMDQNYGFLVGDRSRIIFII